MQDVAAANLEMSGGDGAGGAGVSKRAIALLLAAAIALGVGLRLKHYFARNAYWHDEASLVLNIFEKSATQLLGPLESAQAAAPGFLLVERGVYVLLGRSELAMRLPPLLAAFVGMAIFTRLAWQLFATRARAPLPHVALLLVALWACSDRLIWHAAEAKQYSVDVLVSLLLLAIALDGARGATRRLVGCAAVAAVAVWFSHATAFVFGGISLALLPAIWRGGGREGDSNGAGGDGHDDDVHSGPGAARHGRGIAVSLFVWLACNAAFGASFLALYFISVRDQQVNALYDYWAGGFVDFSRWWMIPIWFVRQLQSICNYPLDIGGPVLLPLTIVGGIFLWRHRRGADERRGDGDGGGGGGDGKLADRSRRRELLAVLVMPAVLVLVASALRQYPFTGSRLTLFLAPNVFLLAGFGVAALGEWARGHANRRWFAVAVPWYLVAVGAWWAAVYVVRPPQYGNMPAAVRYVAARDAPGDLFYANKISEFRCYWPDVPPERLRDAQQLAHGEVPDGRFWLVLSYMPGRSDRLVKPLLAEVRPAAQQLETFSVPGGAAMLFDGNDDHWPSTQRSAAAD